MDAIKKEMLKAFEALLGKYSGIDVRYEFSHEYGCYIVSVDVSNLEKSKLDDFSELLLVQIKDLQNKFGEEAPLFCINEEWFSLSSNAITYAAESVDESVRIGTQSSRSTRLRVIERVYHH